MIKLVTFDLDDTLWDVRPALLQAEAAQWDWLEARFGAAIDRRAKEHHSRLKKRLLNDEPALKHHISRFRRTFIEQLLIDAGIDGAVAADAATEAFDIFLEVRQQVAVYPEAEPMLRTLSRHFTLGALTNGNADVSQTSLGKWFSVVYRAEQIGASKPAPDMFRAAARTAGVEPSQMVHVGDHLEHDVAGAKQFGARSVWFNPDGNKDALADASISCLSALPDVLLKWHLPADRG